MNLLASIPFLSKRKREPKQIISSSWEDRKKILEKDVNLFTWRREPSLLITKYLNLATKQDLPPIVFTCLRDELSSKIRDRRSLWDPKNLAIADAFWKDVELLVADFMNTAKVNQSTVHLRIIDNNACSKFHVDGYPLRLFTTYYGEGTEWLSERNTNRHGLGKRNEDIVLRASEVNRMDTMEVGILKGEVVDQNLKGSGIVHRSPPIEESGSKRIILRVDI